MLTADCVGDRLLSGGRFRELMVGKGSGCDSTVSDFTAGKLPPKLSDRGADVRGRQ